MRRRYFRNDQAKYAYVHNLKSAFRQMFKNARRFCWTQAFMLESRAKLLGGNGVTTSPGSWEKLTDIERSCAFGYWEALSDSLVDELKGMYHINGKWYTPSEVIDRKDGVEPGRDVESGGKNYHFVFVVNTENGPEYRIWF